MALIRGPFTIKWGDNTIQDVEEIEVNHEIASDDFETIQGQTYEIDGSYKASVVLTLLASDIPALAAVLPQHYVANGDDLSTGETVNHAQGAIDIVPRDCDEDIVYNNLDIISCANPSNIMRLVNARSKMEGIEVDNRVQKVMVKFVGEPAQNEATMQFFREGTINTVS